MVCFGLQHNTKTENGTIGHKLIFSAAPSLGRNTGFGFWSLGVEPQNPLPANCVSLRRESLHISPGLFIGKSTLPHEAANSIQSIPICTILKGTPNLY